MDDRQDMRQGFDPSRFREQLERIVAVAITPGEYSGPAFDEIAAIATECLANLGAGGQNA